MTVDSLTGDPQRKQISKATEEQTVIPTYEEFNELAKARFLKYEDMASVGKDKIEEYLSSEESVDIIRQQYDISLKELERGEITEDIFRNGSVSAAAYCLYMLY